MRWDGQAITADDGALPGLGRMAGLVRTVRTPEFAGVTFHEVLAKSALSKVPGESRMPFTWTINPYRGCSHACSYCFARPSHRYLDMNPGEDFDSQIVVKMNVADVLRTELAKPSWTGDAVALGTNTDPYQRAEGRYRLMPGIIDALEASRTPFSILTKGTLLRRDLPRLTQAAEHVDVGIGVSLAFVDEGLQQAVEPGTPTPRARLDLIRAARAAGLPCGVMIAPVLPWLTDSTDHLTRLLDAVHEAGATGATVLPLFLKPGTREWFMAWLRRDHPERVAGYERVYAGGSYASRAYRDWLWARVRPLLVERGFASAGHRSQARTSGHARTAWHPETRPEGTAPDEGAYPAGSLVQRRGPGHGPRRPGDSASTTDVLF